MEYKELQKTIEKLDNGVYEICIKNGQITKINKEKNLTPYQKTEYFLSNYPGLKNRKEYLKKSLDNIELKKIYSINEIKATNKDNLSDVEKIEMIKEERIKEILKEEGDVSKKLTDEANKNGGMDNITVVVIKK